MALMSRGLSRWVAEAGKNQLGAGRGRGLVCDSFNSYSSLEKKKHRVPLIRKGSIDLIRTLIGGSRKGTQPTSLCT